MQNGYVSILSRNHPRADYHGYVLEHRLVMEKKIGQYLTAQEVVHHINGVRDDNRIENLMLFAKHSEHIKYEFSNGERSMVQEHIRNKAVREGQLKIP